MEATLQDVMSDELTIRDLSAADVDEIQGGFVCGGLCVAGAFALGAAIGGGATYWALN